MEDTKKLTAFQLITLITVSEIMHQYTFMPVLSTIPRNQDSWIQLAFFIPYVIILCIPVLFLLSKFRNITFYDMMTLILGKIGGKIGIFIFCLFFCFCNIACLTLSIIFLKNYILISTPSTFIAIAILIPSTYIAIKGLKTMCRLSTIVFFDIAVTILLFFIFSINQLDFNLLKPILIDSSFLQINIGAFLTASRFSDVLILLIAAYRLEDQKKTNKVLYTSVIFYFIISLMMVIPVITLLGVAYGLQANNPYFVFARQVEFYTFLQRAEVFVMVSWLAGAILKISIYHYFMSYYIAKIFSVKNFKNLVIPAVILTFSIIFILGLDKSYIIYNIRSDAIFPWIVLFFILVLPIIILIIYFIRRKKIDINKQLMLQ